MSGESDDVDRLAQSIADGASINWTELDKLPADARLRRLFALLQMVDEVAEVHRSLGDASPAPDPAPADLPSDEPLDSPSADGIDKWGHLLLRRKIGEGGFGEVYHAHDTWLDHPVALKLFKPHVASRHSTERILHEARKLARVRHPNVVIIHGADSHDGRVGFWMDLVEGVTLEHIVRNGRLNAGEAAYVGQEICRALAAVHFAGIIHRDVKAQNVMRASHDGRIILMDFGAGEFIKDQAANRSTQGTPLYLAPEVLAGEDASAQSDIYAVGVLLYFLVTGGFPVKGSSIAHLLDAHKRGDRRRLRDGRPDLPGGFVSIVERALDPDPTRRFMSAGEMEAALSGGSLVREADMLGPFHGRDVGRPIVQTLSIAATVVVIATAIVGWIACRLFDTVVGVHSDLAAGPADYLSVGAVALLPFGIFWSIGVGVLAVLAGIGLLLRTPLAAFRTRMHWVKRSADGATVATLVLVTGIAGWLAILWHCADIFSAIGALISPNPVTAELSMLGSAGRSLQRTLYVSSAYLSFLLALAIWRWFPRFELDAVDPSRVRLLKWATVAVASLVVVAGTAPWRLAWERFEVVAFENRSAVVIASTDDELLLYYPYIEAPKHRRVRRDAPALQRTGAQARLFDR